MREGTGSWLAPLIEAASTQLADDDMIRCMSSATMPAREADDPGLDALTSSVEQHVHMKAMDWIRFGQLLRDRLGWTDYPEEPLPTN